MGGEEMNEHTGRERLRGELARCLMAVLGPGEMGNGGAPLAPTSVHRGWHVWPPRRMEGHEKLELNTDGTWKQNDHASIPRGCRPERMRRWQQHRLCAEAPPATAPWMRCEADQSRRVRDAFMQMARAAWWAEGRHPRLPAAWHGRATWAKRAAHPQCSPRDS